MYLEDIFAPHVNCTIIYNDQNMGKSLIVHQQIHQQMSGYKICFYMIRVYMIYVYMHTCVYLRIYVEYV